MIIEEAVKEKVDYLLNKSPKNMAHSMGINFQEFSLKKLRAFMTVGNQTIQPFGMLHGGASVALSETLCSVGAWLNVTEPDKIAVGVEINANHLRPVRLGETVFATAEPIQVGRTIQVWQCRIINEKEKPICISRCTLSVVNHR